MPCVASPEQCGGWTCWPCRYAAAQRENTDLRAKLADVFVRLQAAESAALQALDRAEAAKRERDALRAELDRSKVSAE